MTNLTEQFFLFSNENVFAEGSDHSTMGVSPGEGRYVSIVTVRAEFIVL